MAETKSGSVKVQWHGPQYSESGATYIAPLDRKPRMYATVNWSITRSSQQSSRVTITLGGSLWRLAESSSYVKDPLTGNYGGTSTNSHYYEYEIQLYASACGTEHLIARKYNDGGNYTRAEATAANGWKGGRWRSDISTGNTSFDVEWPSNNKISISFRAYGQCYELESPSCSAGNFSKVIAESEVPYYNPYTAPSYSYNSITPSIGVYNETTFKPNYTITKGTGNIEWVDLRLYDANNNYLTDYSMTAGSGTYTGSFKLSTSKAGHEGQYNTSIRFKVSDNDNAFETGKRTIYTYRVPTVTNVYFSNPNFSSTGNSTLYWTVNGRKWSNTYEADYKTQLYIGLEGKWFDAGTHAPNSGSATQQSQTMSRSFLESHFTKDQLSADTISASMKVKRTNPSSGKSATSGEVRFSVQNKPKYEVLNLTYKNASNSSTINKGSTIYVEKVSNINVSWSYTDAVDRGNFTGYVIKVYDSNDTSKTPVFEDTTSSTSKQIPVSKLTRGALHYIKVARYYNAPNGTVLYGPSTLYSFVKPIKSLAKPKISYPVNGSKWHNHKFRILFELPEDGDYSSYDKTTQDNYQYNNIQVSINDVIYTFSGHSSMFSTSALRHKRRICLNPSVLGIAQKESYTIKVRVQKKYYEQIWSDWSDEITVNVVDPVQITCDKENKIYASTYNTVRNQSKQLYDAYPINNLPANNIEATASSTVIQDEHFKAIYDTILGIQSGVNSWAVYDSTKSNIKFNQSITELNSPNQPKVEYITAVKDPRPNPEGRNYMLILIDAMNKLY